jgi:hypothetical protein
VLSKLFEFKKRKVIWKIYDKTDATKFDTNAYLYTLRWKNWFGFIEHKLFKFKILSLHANLSSFSEFQCYQLGFFETVSQFLFIYFLFTIVMKVLVL